MTTLSIIPNYEKKRLKCYGTVAAGEHVLVTVTGGMEWVAPDGENQTLRMRLLFGPHTVGVFPFVTEEMHDADPETFPTVDAWDTDGDDPTCDLNLNTIQAAKYLKFGGNCLFVLDDPTNDILYATGEFEVLPWPKRRGADLPYDLDGYPDFVFDAKNAMAEAAETAQNAANAASAAEATAARLEQDVYGHRQAAEAAATNAQNSASSASNFATEAKGWANGGTDGDTPTATNNAKYYAGQAGDAKTDAAASATGAAASATAAANSATAASGSATSAAASAQSAAGAAEAAVETEKERAEGAESDLADAIDAEKERAEVAEALAIVNAEYNGTSRRIVFTTGGGDTIAIDASAFIKDGMISSVSVSNGNLVITFNSDAGKQPISIPLTQIFNPSNYYDKTAADGTFVKKDGAKVLSTNDYTTAEKQKLAGIDNGANAYVLPPATSSALGGVKQGTGCEITEDGTLNVTGGGGGGTVDDSVTRTSANPVKSSGIWSAIWGALSALPTGFASLYDYCMGWFADAKSLAPLWDIEAAIYHIGDLCVESRMEGASGRLYRCKKEYTPNSDSDGPSHDTEHWEPIDVTTLIANKQDALSIAQLANIAAVPGKADSADLRYRIATAELVAILTSDVTIMLGGNTVTSYDFHYDDDYDGFGHDGFGLSIFEPERYKTVPLWSGDGTPIGNDPNITFVYGGESTPNPPILLFHHELADRTVNIIAADEETSIDIELPALANVGRMRDFYVRLTVSATCASTWTIGQGESWDAMGSPPGSFAAGTYLYRISEVAAGVWHCEDLFGVLNRIPKYPMISVTPSNGTLTVMPYTVATYTAGDSAAAFTVAVGTGETGKARDCELVIDCTETGAVAPTVTWPSMFHPRTDAATDFACEAGKRNVYFISEFAPGEFAVGGWQETAGGNA